MGMLPPSGLLDRSPQKLGPMWMATGLHGTVRPVKSNPLKAREKGRSKTDVKMEIGEVGEVWQNIERLNIDHSDKEKERDAYLEPTWKPSPLKHFLMLSVKVDWMFLSGKIQTALLSSGMSWLGSDRALEKVANRTRSLVEMERDVAKSAPAAEMDAAWEY